MWRIIFFVGDASSAVNTFFVGDASSVVNTFFVGDASSMANNLVRRRPFVDGQHLVRDHARGARVHGRLVVLLDDRLPTWAVGRRR